MYVLFVSLTAWSPPVIFCERTANRTNREPHEPPEPCEPRTARTANRTNRPNRANREPHEPELAEPNLRLNCFEPNRTAVTLNFAKL